MMQPRANDDARPCGKLAALDRVVRCMVRAREELMASVGTETDALSDFWIGQLRTARAVFHQRLIKYLDHYRDCAACQSASEDLPASLDDDFFG